jgi:hypothetical protein
MREDTRGRVGRWTTGNGALEVLKAWCEVRSGRAPRPSDVALKSGGVPAVIGGTMISMGRRRWRSQVPSVNSPECVEGEFSEVRLAHRTVASCLRWKKLASPRCE